MSKDKHARLQQLLLDRKSKEPKGRASVPFPIILDADLAVAVNQAQQDLDAAQGAIDKYKADQAKAREEGTGDRRHGSKASAVPKELTDALAEAEKRVEEADAAADAAMVQLVLVALKSDEYDELTKLHPPREGDKKDAEDGVNRETFFAALLRDCATKVLDADDDEIEMDIDDVIGGMSHGEREVAFVAVRNLNMQMASVPFFSAKSQARRRKGAR
jgi:hypothetical protein